MGQHTRKTEIAKLQIRKKEIDEAIAKRTIPRAPVDSSGIIASITTSAPKQQGDAASDNNCDSMPSLTNSSSDGSDTDFQSSGQTSDSDTETDRVDVEFCVLRNKPS